MQISVYICTRNGTVLHYFFFLVQIKEDRVKKEEKYEDLSYKKSTYYRFRCKEVNSIQLIFYFLYSLAQWWAWGKKRLIGGEQFSIKTIKHPKKSALLPMVGCLRYPEARRHPRPQWPPPRCPPWLPRWGSGGCSPRYDRGLLAPRCAYTGVLKKEKIHKFVIQRKRRAGHFEMFF